MREFRWSDARRAVAEWSAKHRWYLALLLVWTVELWWSQSLTTAPTLWSASDMVRKDVFFRLLFDLLGLALLLGRAHRVVIAFFIFWSLVFHFATISYHAQYDRAISVFTIIGQLGEGTQVMGAAFALTRSYLMLFVPLLVVKGFLLWRAERENRLAEAVSRRGMAVLVAGYLALFAGVTLDHKPIWRIGKWETVSGIGFTYGYVPAWVGELLFIKREKVLERAMERMAKVSDQLTPHEIALPLRRNLVFIQMESFDEKALGFAIRGTPVTPALTALRERSMFFRIQAHKYTGSCDSDFTALMGRIGSQDFPSYRIEGIPWNLALPHDLHKGSFSSMIFHGVSGHFFHRMDAMPQMGFDGLFFKEQIAAEAGLDAKKWTLADTEVFDFARSRILASKPRTFAMVITATSHMPFRFETPGMERIFFGDDPAYQNNYFDSIRYVDKSVGDFVASLPPDTTVILYGDHWSTVQNPEVGYEQEVIDGFGMVPFLVYNVGEDLSSVQKTRGTPMALGAQLSLHDMMTWVHHTARSVGMPVSMIPPAPGTAGGSGEGSGSGLE